LDAFRSIKTEGIADNDFFNIMVSDQVCQSVQNLIPIFTYNRGQTLAGQPQFITEGNSDSFASIVETEDSHLA
jgi:glycosylphosphatidylinositol transamidase (GPIT) subunit GPI8